MATAFDRWEKDPFFSVAEEVQESADRMESTYRTWLAALKNTNGVWNVDELGRDLRTVLGTTKYNRLAGITLMISDVMSLDNKIAEHLEEFERATRSSYISSNSADQDARDRHQEFIVAIKNQITKVERSLTKSTVSHGKPPLPWVKLDEGERNELALFLSEPSLNMTSSKGHSVKQGVESLQEAYGLTTNRTSSRSSAHLVELDQVSGKKEKFPGHRRTASASADIGSWKIMVPDDVLTHSQSKINPDPPPRKIPSISSFLNTMESSVSQLKWSRNGYKKLTVTDQPQELDATLPKHQSLTRGTNLCYEKSKSCIAVCDDCYDKQWYGWYGSIRRQLQRSQYHIQYSRPVQVIFSVIFLLCLLGELAKFTLFFTMTILVYFLAMILVRNTCIC
ncbi:syntaxin/t-SNARE family protein [Striga asiatica]|uniref:Syntaxin/t-SNARE family protein n=1 Tax=Striga asiatica TaxID=4170 RepID=A0A5A7RK92_STRAF|nr:syntaxin/t-SNARE family protein [Striga asiatica]